MACSPATRARGQAALAKSRKNPATGRKAATGTPKPRKASTRRNPTAVSGPRVTLAGIRKLAKEAATARLAGNMPLATRLDRQLDQMVSLAEKRGRGDAAYEAEEEGRESASRRNPAPARRTRRKTTRRNPATATALKPAPAARSAPCRCPHLPSPLSAGEYLVLQTGAGGKLNPVKAFRTVTDAENHVKQSTGARAVVVRVMSTWEG